MTFIKLHSSSYIGDDKLSEGDGRLGSHTTDTIQEEKWKYSITFTADAYVKKTKQIWFAGTR